MTRAQVKIQMDERIGALEPCIAAAVVHGKVDAIQCSGRTWQLAIQIRTARNLVDRFVPVVCDAHALVVVAQQVGEVMQSEALRQAASATRPS